jgi:hypothetical protein
MISNILGINRNFENSILVALVRDNRDFAQKDTLGSLGSLVSPVGSDLVDKIKPALEKIEEAKSENAVSDRFRDTNDSG